LSVNRRRGLGCGVRCACARWHSADTHPAWQRESAGDSVMASDLSRRLCDAAEEGDVEGIAAALLAGADPNALVNDWTPLQRAAHNGHVAAIAALLAAGAHVDGASRSGKAPLMFAAIYGQTTAVAALLAAGANVNHANKGGSYTVLHWTARSGRVDAARLLLDAGARTEVRSKYGKRPIDVVGAPGRLLVAAVWSRYTRFAAALPCAGVCWRGCRPDRRTCPDFTADIR
jgi:hypothetical protein